MNLIKKFASILAVVAIMLVVTACKDDPKPETTIGIKTALSAEKDAEVTIEGIVIGYGDGKYLAQGAAYIYNPQEDSAIYVIFTADPEKTPEIGQKIKLTGVKDIYGGLPQVKNYTFEVLQEGIDVKQYYKEVTIDQLKANAGDPVASTGYILKPVLIKNVVISSNPDSNTGTDFMDLNGNKISVYRFGYIAMSNKQVGDVVNLYANVTAYKFGETGQVIQLHAAYATDMISLEGVTNLSEQNKLDFAKLSVNLPTTVTDNLTLPTTLSTGVAVSWASSDAATINTTGTVTRPATGAGDKSVTLTASFSIGTLTPVTKTFTITVTELPAPDPITVADALAAAVNTEVFVQGIVSNLTTKGFVIQDADGKGIYVYTGSAPTVAIGDKINVNGTRAEFKKVPQIGSVSNISAAISTGNATAAPTAVTDLATFKASDVSAFGKTYTFSNVTVTYVSTAYIYFYDDNSNNKIAIYVSELNGVTLPTIAAGDVLNITGTLYASNNDYNTPSIWRINVKSANDVTVQ